MGNRPLIKHGIDFKVGKSYYIDERQNNKESIVTLIHFYPETQMFCKVRNEETGYEWETMLNRLTEIDE
jgi:DNA gyrase/topoisomerase IV subunit B